MAGRKPVGQLTVMRAVLDIEKNLTEERYIAAKEIHEHPLMKAYKASKGTKQNFIQGAEAKGWLRKHPFANGLYKLTDAGRKALLEVW